MDVRNAAYNQYGTIDCEINHPVFGWIPFTASPDDVEPHGREIYADLIASGAVAAYIPVVVPAPLPPAPPTLTDLQAQLTALQAQITALTSEA
jgi:hypothetical protein